MVGTRGQNFTMPHPRTTTVTTYPKSIYNKSVADESKLKLKCPICKKPVPTGGEDFPFCSERCRLIDLGKWASGQYVVSSPVTDISDEAELQNFPGPDDED